MFHMSFKRGQDIHVRYAGRSSLMGVLSLISILLVSLLAGCSQSNEYSQNKPPDISHKLQATAGIVYEVYEKVDFTEEEKAKIITLSKGIPYADYKEFWQKYEAWRNTWDDPALSIHSNTRAWALSEEYNELLGYCKEKGKTIWPLVFQQVVEEYVNFNGNLRVEILMILTNDLTLDEYGYIYDMLREEHLAHQYTEEGYFINRSNYAIRHVKELLALL